MLDLDIHESRISGSGKIRDQFFSWIKYVNFLIYHDSLKHYKSYKILFELVQIFLSFIRKAHVQHPILISSY